MKFRKILVLLMMLMLISACASEEEREVTHSEEKILVAVSIVPQAAFVEAVAGDKAEVITMIPPGSSPANYQPKPQTMAKLSKAQLYLGIGVPAEKSNILNEINDFNKEIKVVHLDEIVSAKYPDRYFSEEEAHDHDEDHNHDAHETDKDHHDHGHEEEHDHESEHNHEEHDHEDEHNHEEGHSHEGKDPHIWLSPKRVVVMIESMVEEFVLLDPENAEYYRERGEVYISELVSLEQDIAEILESHDGQHFIIYHPSLGYFADDFNLNQVALESEGKEATLASLKDVVDLARNKDIKVILYQTEMDSKQAKIIADELGGRIMAVDPLAYNYIENLQELASIFEKVAN